MPNERISDIRIERVALELLDQYSITDPGFDIEDLAEAERLEVRRGELKNIDAWLVRKPGGGGIIRLREDTPEAGRVRFSIAHEIGHWLLHPGLSQGFLCTAADMVDYARSPEEAEANRFAANLLMPKSWIPAATWKKDPEFNVTAGLAKDFKTTLTAATRRYVELATHAVVLVFSQNGTIHWSLKSPRAKSLFLERAVSVPANSLTRECIDQGENAGAGQVEPDAWFPDWHFDDDSEVFEDVRISTTYGWAMTILWVPELG
jgi:Zn-dependent peptidase ImmA (M78 family)